MQLTFMTYNIQSGRNLLHEPALDGTAREIAAHAPDLVVLNEVRMGTSDWAGLEQARALGEATGMQWAFGAAIEILGGRYGNALLSRAPILTTDVFPVEDVPEAQRERHYEPRAVLRCTVDLSGTRIAVYGTHFGLSDAEQRAAVRTLCRLLDRETLPVIFSGDLNVTPDHPVLDPLYARLTDLHARSTLAHTYPSGDAQIKIDYIFVSAGMQALSLDVPDTQASDHRPIVARLRIGEGTADET